jgi:hypothetical protein
MPELIAPFEGERIQTTLEALREIPVLTPYVDWLEAKFGRVNEQEFIEFGRLQDDDEKRNWLESQYGDLDDDQFRDKRDGHDKMYRMYEESMDMFRILVNRIRIGPSSWTEITTEQDKDNFGLPIPTNRRDYEKFMRAITTEILFYQILSERCGPENVRYSTLREDVGLARKDLPPGLPSCDIVVSIKPPLQPEIEDLPNEVLINITTRENRDTRKNYDMIRLKYRELRHFSFDNFSQIYYDSISSDKSFEEIEQLARLKPEILEEIRSSFARDDFLREMSSPYKLLWEEFGNMIY